MNTSFFCGILVQSIMTLVESNDMILTVSAFTTVVKTAVKDEDDPDPKVANVLTNTAAGQIHLQFQQVRNN
jgi:hypothetical protein